MDKLISRQAAIELAKDLIIPSESFHQYNQGVNNYCAELVKLQPAQPSYNPDEWCHDCKEYDQERHCCPRWNRVIRKTVDELELNRQKGGKNDQYTGSRLAEGLRATSG
jgi:hypothetical protein